MLLLLLTSERPDEQPHNNTIDIDIEVAADNDPHDSQMITQDISDDDNDDAHADDDDDDETDDGHGQSAVEQLTAVFLRCDIYHCLTTQ